MPAFATPAPVPSLRPHTLSFPTASPSPHIHPRPPRMTLTRRPRPPSLLPGRESPQRTKTDLAHLKGRSLLTLRGLSDLGTAAVLHELSLRLLIAPSVSVAGAADSQLLLGGLIGLWTAAAFAQRLSEQTDALIQESQALPGRWDAAYVYRPAIEPDDAVAAVAWLHAFDEMEGPAAADLLQSLAQADRPALRVELANALARYPTRSNVALSVLHSLAQDADADVRDAANTALSQYRTAGVLVATRPGYVEQQKPAEQRNDELDMAAVLDRLFEDPPVEDFAGPKHTRTSWVLDAVAERVEAMGSAALSRPDLRQLGAAVVEAEKGNVLDTEAKPVPKKLQVPLFEGLRWEEVHGLCTLALVPAGYELLSLFDGGNLPFRFVGLGWLLSVGGMVAYPQSGELWTKFKNTLDDHVAATRSRSR